MKRFFAIVLSVALMFFALVGCGKNAETDNPNGENTQLDSSSLRSPMQKYEKLGVSNKNATSDGRYIYYTYWCSEENKGKLYRADMDFQNPTLLWTYDLSLASPLYIDDGYLYFCQGKAVKRIDIATAPNFFDMTEDGDVNCSYFFDKLSWPAETICSDDNYFYCTSSGIEKIKKDAIGYENICGGNFYDLYISGNYLYSYCGDDQTIYRISTDGSEQTPLYRLPKSWLVYKDYVYHTAPLDWTLRETNPSTGETKDLATLAEKVEQASICNAIDNKLYYTFKSDNTINLKTYDLITGEISDLGILAAHEDGIITQIDIVNNYVFTFNHNNLLSITRIDSTGLTKINW